MEALVAAALIIVQTVLINAYLPFVMQEIVQIIMEVV